MTKGLYSRVDALNDKASARFSVGSGDAVLTGIIILSGVLSAIFFWQQSRAVFGGVWPPLALLLGLAVGLLPAEGAFFGWRRIRATKRDMTQRQMTATTCGIVASVAFSVFSTFALFVVSFDQVPADVRALGTWFVFVALSVPIICQVCIYAYYTVNERAVVQNYEQAHTSALTFDGWTRAERARVMAILDGVDRELDAQLEGYGTEQGSMEALRMLAESRSDVLRPPSAAEAAPAMELDELIDYLVAERMKQQARPAPQPAPAIYENGRDPGAGNVARPT